MKSNGSRNGNYGFQFILDADGIGEPQIISPRFMERYSGLLNEDGVSVVCGEDGYMPYTKGKDVFTSFWVCPVCSRRVEAREVYEMLQQINDDFLRENDLE